VTQPTDLAVGGFVPLSTVDWPSQLAATVFTRGCPWDCPYCHNPHLLAGAPAQGDAASGEPTWPQVLAFLDTRRGLLDAVVFTGGEPTIQAALADAIAEVRDRGFSVGLHTGGPLPDRLATLLPSLDWVGFDVKAPFSAYERVTRVAGSGERALASLRTLVASGVEFEARTTVHSDLLTAADIACLADELEREGVRRWAIQGFRTEGARPGMLAPARVTQEMLPAGLAERFDFTLR
jgi:pyruvate formate lyase activating enzyme